jgi:catalase
MRFDGNGGKEVNSEPNSFGGPTQDPKYAERPKQVSGTMARHDHRADAKQRLINNIVGSLKNPPERIQKLPAQHFYKTDPAYGTGVAKGLGLDINSVVEKREMVLAD